LDLDPYGSPWGFLAAFLQSRPLERALWIVVNDGLRQKLRMGGAWHVGCLAEIVARRGNDLHDVYLDVVEEMAAELAKKAGGRLDRFGGYYCGSGKQMTHWTAKLLPAASFAGGGASRKKEGTPLSVTVQPPICGKTVTPAQSSNRMRLTCRTAMMT
jgi:hypothetical protein